MIFRAKYKALRTDRSHLTFPTSLRVQAWLTIFIITY